MRQLFKHGIGGSYYKGFMEWQCCENLWQLQMWKGQPKRKDWYPECSKCGSVGLAFNQFTKEEQSMVMQKGKEAGGTSLRPSDAVEGGGLLDNVDVTWEEVRFEMWDYNGTQQPSPALKVGMVLEDGDKADQFFSCGKAEDWTPSKDGTKLVPIGGARGLNKASNFMILLDSLIKADFPEDKIGDDCTVFEGLECHMVRIPAPKRPGLAPAKARADGRTYERTNFVVDVIHKLPWDKKGTGKGKKEEASDDAVAEKTTEAILAILEANPKGLTKQKLAGQVFTKLKGDSDAMAAAQLANKDDFLKEGPWSFDKGMVSQA